MENCIVRSKAIMKKSKKRKCSFLVKELAFFMIMITLFISSGCSSKNNSDKNKSESTDDNSASVHSDESFQEWKKIYSDFINDNYDNWKEDISYRVDRLKYDIIYINCDAIPECVIAFDDSHVSGVYILTADENGNVYCFGEYGESGTIYYVPDQNIISMSYGNQGFYRRLFLSIQDFKLKINGAGISDAHMPEKKYYLIDPTRYKDKCVYSSRGSLTGARECSGDLDVLSDVLWGDYKSMETDEEEFEKTVSEFGGGYELTAVKYDQLRFSIDISE